MYIASVVERLPRKPNLLLDIILSYESLIPEITIEMIIFEQVAMIERPLQFAPSFIAPLFLKRKVMEEINQDAGKIQDVQIVEINNIK